MKMRAGFLLASAALSSCILFIPFGLECGDGTAEVNEECDDGNSVNDDGCDSNCTNTACGNNVVTAGEVCDDGNTADGDGCAADCSRLEGCGNGVVDANEVCDDGDELSTNECRGDCLKIQVCGDGELDGNEVCDDGNTTAGDGCSADCQVVEGCGNGVIDANEQCDDGNVAVGDGCSNACQIEFCGDGNIDINEQCDDGNNLPNDGCTPECQDESPTLDETESNDLDTTSNALITNDITVNADITHDAGGGRDNDFFSLRIFFTTDLKIDVLPINPNSCNNRIRMALMESDLNILAETSNNGASQCPAINFASDKLSPGDYFLRIQEQNSGSASADLQYKIIVTVESVCGDGAKTSTEACDDSRQCSDGVDCESNFTCLGIGDELCRPRNNDGCRGDCRGLEVCGDGVIDDFKGEQCDDDNTASGDGCSASCQREAGFNCSGEPTSCNEICGDGLIVGGEECDDGDTASGDGCNGGCVIESGFDCTGAPSVCSTTCGDNIAAGNEACDGADLNGSTCATINAATPNGTLSCNANCSGFVTDLCTL